MFLIFLEGAKVNIKRECEDKFAKDGRTFRVMLLFYMNNVLLDIYLKFDSPHGI